MNAIRRILTDDGLALSIRISAGLVLLFGQPVHRLVALRIEDTDTTDTAVRIRFGRDSRRLRRSVICWQLTWRLDRTCRPPPTVTAHGCSPAPDRASTQAPSTCGPHYGRSAHQRWPAAPQPGASS